MNYQDYELKECANERQWVASEAFPVLMRKVYVWMTLALVITGLTAYGVATTPAMRQIFVSSGLFWVLAIAELAIVFGVTAAINRISLTTATLLFTLYSVINGLLLSSIFLVYTATSIASVFFITAGTFGAMALVGYTTKTDLSSMGKILFMALIGLIIASVVNIFVGSKGLDLIISYVGVLIFVGLTAWDTQKIKNMLLEAPDASESMQKIALLGALTLYLDFINLFIYLLRIFGKRN
jgi:FtsH-binding integral membrane protein